MTRTKILVQNASSSFQSPFSRFIFLAVKQFLAMLLAASFAAASAEPFHALFGSAQRAMQSGLWDVAALHLESASSSSDIPAEQIPEIRLLLAQCLLRDNRPEEALAILDESAVRQHPQATFWIGQALAGSGRFAEAAETLATHAAIPANPFRQAAAFTAANLHLSLSQPEAALDALSLLNSVDSQLRRVGLLLDLDRADEARVLFPVTAEIPASLSRFATLLEAHLLLAEGKPAEAEPLFSSLLSDPEGQSLDRHNLAAIGKADSLAAQGDIESATETLFSFIQSRPETAQLAPMFGRIVAWLPETIPSTEQPTLARLSEWTPQPSSLGNGFINTAADSAAAAWPKPLQPITDLEVFALHARALALRRIPTPTAKAEAAALLQRLRLLSPNHFLVPGTLLTLASWKMEDGNPEIAFDILETLRRNAKSPLVKGEAAFRNAINAYRDGDPTLAADLFAEAAVLLEGGEREAAALNSALARLGEDPTATLTIQNVEPEVAEKLAVDLLLEKALAIDSAEAAKTALDSFLKEHPDHPRAPEARLAVAEAALGSVPPDLSRARAQLETLDASESPLPDSLAPRLALARLRLLDFSGDAATTITMANQIIADLPGTHAASEAALTLGKNLFQTGNHNEARLALEKLAASEPGTQRSQAALLLAARSAALGATAQSREEALTIYDRTMETEGPLKALALLEKARLLIDLNRLPAAIETLSAAYAAIPPDDPSRLPTGLLLAEAIYARGDSDPDSLSKALEIYDSLLDISSASPTRYFRLQYLRGLALEKLPDPEEPSRTRMDEARAAYFSVIDRPIDPPPAEWEWLERSGFRLLTLLETEEDWKAAITVAGKIASFGGPRAEEAATRARQLRLKHMVWED